MQDVFTKGQQISSTVVRAKPGHLRTHGSQELRYRATILSTAGLGGREARSSSLSTGVEVLNKNAGVLMSSSNLEAASFRSCSSYSFCWPLK